MTDSPTLALTKALISQASVTPEDADCQKIMCERLAACGFDITPLHFGDVKNFWATRGDGQALMFAGHTDVVPTGDVNAWQTPPFEPTVKDGVLYGRGTADMKGSLAAMVTAVERFVANHPNHQGRIAFLVTSDEEGPAVDGTVRVIDYLQETNQVPKWCLVGEPSSTAKLGDIIKNGRRGSLGAVLTVQGTQGHIAYPHLADNPIHRGLTALAALADAEWDKGNEFFPATSMQFSNINSGTGATNVIPGTLSAMFNFRFSTEITAEQLKEKTHAILDQFDMSYSIDWNLSGNPFLTTPGDLTQAIVNSIEHHCGYTPELSTTGGTSDGRFIATMGTQVCELGPINATIHKVDECVNIADLDKLSLVYESVLEGLIA